MRLICGVFQLDGALASETLLRAMAQQMDVPRLQPSMRMWRDGSVGLALLDFSARGAMAPALPETGALTMAADVRFDEPAALAWVLGTVPEPEDALLLAAFERFGPSGLDKVLGDFAFAVWNRDTQRLICARDAFGVRPLAYVYKPGKLFAFASLPKALHGSGIIPKKVDEDALARRMVGALRADDSLIAGVKRLPAAHYIEVTREGVSLKRYWQMDRAAVGTRRCSPEDAAFRARARRVRISAAVSIPRRSRFWPRDSYANRAARSTPIPSSTANATTSLWKMKAIS